MNVPQVFRYFFFFSYKPRAHVYLYPSLSASGAFHPRSNVFWEGLGRIFRNFPSRLHSQSHAFYVGANPAASFCKIRHATPSVPTQSARAKHFTRIHTRKHTNISMWHILSSVLSRLHRKRVTVDYTSRIVEAF